MRFGPTWDCFRIETARAPSLIIVRRVKCSNPLTPLVFCCEFGRIALSRRLFAPPVENLPHRLVDGQARGVEKNCVGIML